MEVGRRRGCCPDKRTTPSRPRSVAADISARRPMGRGDKAHRQLCTLAARAHDCRAQAGERERGGARRGGRGVARRVERGGACPGGAGGRAGLAGQGELAGVWGVWQRAGGGCGTSCVQRGGWAQQTACMGAGAPGAGRTTAPGGAVVGRLGGCARGAPDASAASQAQDPPPPLRVRGFPPPLQTPPATRDCHTYRIAIATNPHLCRPVADGPTYVLSLKPRKRNTGRGVVAVGGHAMRGKRRRRTANAASFFVPLVPPETNSARAPIPRGQGDPRSYALPAAAGRVCSAAAAPPPRRCRTGERGRGVLCGRPTGHPPRHRTGTGRGVDGERGTPHRRRERA